MPSLEKRVKEQLKEEILPPCPKCLDLVRREVIRTEMMQPLPYTRVVLCNTDKKTNEPICYDCDAAWTVMRLKYAPTWEAARIAVGNDRQEQYRLPGVATGLVAMGLVRPSAAGDLERHHRWLDHYNWFDIPEEERNT